MRNNIENSHYYSSVASILCLIALVAYFMYSALDGMFFALLCIAHILSAIYHSVRKD